MEQKTKTPLEKLVLLVLADCHNAATGRCFPSLTFISNRAMCTRRGAMKVIESLESQGFIRAERAAGKRTFYTFHMAQTGELSSRVNSVHGCTQFTSTGELSSKTGELSSPEPGSNQESNLEVGEGPSPPSRFCPHSFRPNGDLMRTARIPEGVDVSAEFEKFRNHEFSRLITDWDRAWLKWLAGATPPRNQNDGRSELQRQTDNLLGL